MMRFWIPILFVALLIGCSARSDRIDPLRGDVIFFVPGVGGARTHAQGFIDGLRDARVGRPVQIAKWGAPLPMFLLNFNNALIHDDAERKLATRIARWRAEHPDARIDVIAHSAGCGVTLGALEQLPSQAQVNEVILLAPSVSPVYRLEPSMTRIAGSLHLYVSERDRTFLDWRTSTFGTYDGVKSRAAGNRGFIWLPPRAFQYPYDPAWRSLGNDGDHFGCLARRFAREVIAPQLAATGSSPSPPAPSQSFAANPD